MKRKESLAELRQRIAKSTLKPEDLRINRPPYRKTSDLFASECRIDCARGLGLGPPVVP